MSLFKNKGSVTGNNQSVATINVESHRTYAFQVSGTFVATLRIQVSMDGETFTTLAGNASLLNPATGAYVSAATITVAGLYALDVSSYVAVRVTSTAYTSGTAVVTAFATDIGNMTPAAGSTTATISGNVSTAEATKLAGTTYNLVTAATTNLVSARSAAANLFEISLSNPTATPVYVKLYNKATAPVVASDVPVITIPVPANSVQVLSFGSQGKRFATGIGLAATGAIGATDATNAVAGVQINATYI